MGGLSRRRTHRTPVTVVPGYACPRLRQVVLVARRLKDVAQRLEQELGLSAAYHDPAVAEFGLENAVYAVGDTFLEVVSPIRDGTSAGRLLEKHGDGGYMVIFQVEDLRTTRDRVAALGVRVVWETDQPRISAVHLHPADVPGAIVSLDEPEPPSTWLWAGPADSAPAGRRGIEHVTVQVSEPAKASGIWASVLDARDGGLHAEVTLDDGRQRIRFVDAAPGDAERIIGVTLQTPSKLATTRRVDISGVEFDLNADPNGADR